MYRVYHTHVVPISQPHPPTECASLEAVEERLFQMPPRRRHPRTILSLKEWAKSHKLGDAWFAVDAAVVYCGHPIPPASPSVDGKLKISQLIGMLQLDATMHGDLDVAVVIDDNIKSEENTLFDVDTAVFTTREPKTMYLGIVGTIREPWEEDDDEEEETKSDPS